MNNEEISRWAKALGHTRPTVEASISGKRYVGTCGCGYLSTTRTTAALAADALIHHIYKAVKAAQVNGALLPDAAVGVSVQETVRAAL